MRKATVVTIPYAELTKLIPLSCIHWPNTNRDLLRQWIDEVLDANTYTILMGDSIDFARATYRGHLASFKKDDTSQGALDSLAHEHVAGLAKELAPLTGRVLGVILGNHFWTYLDGTNSEQDLARHLEVPYLGPQGVVQLRMEESNGGRNQARHVLTIYAHHSGGSGASAPSGLLNSLIKQTTKMDADIYLLGHSHDLLAIHDELYQVDRAGNIVRRDRMLARTGSLYEPKEQNPQKDRRHEAGYHIVKDLKPKRAGWVTIGIIFDKGRGREGKTELRQGERRMWAKY